MRKFVTATSLNFRSAPSIANNIIDALHLGYPVEVLEDADDQFVKVEVDIDGSTKEGFLSGRFLRDPVSAEREALVAAAVTEWKRFKFGLGKEHKKPYFKHVGEMWKSIGLDLDGQDRDQPWSAAAISFMVKKADAALAGSKYSSFMFAAAHSRYVHDSVIRRDRGDTSAPFWGFDLDEAKPQLGDIVCRSRAGSGADDIDFARRHDSFKSHCDIIVAIKSGFVVTIGGNVSHSVKTTNYNLTSGGFLDDEIVGSSNEVYAILVNQH